VSEELQLLGSALDGRLDYIGGVYYFREDATEHATDRFVGIFDQLRKVEVENSSKSVFAQAAYSPAGADRWTFTLGGRYTWDEREATRQRGDSRDTLPARERQRRSDYFDPTIVDYRWSDAVKVRQVHDGASRGRLQHAVAHVRSLRPGKARSL
jgi:outer membrane receptor protein involved in Fe transport